jgi:hypothetical protein
MQIGPGLLGSFLTVGLVWQNCVMTRVAQAVNHWPHLLIDEVAGERTAVSMKQC